MLRRGRTLLREKDRAGELYVLRRGLMMSSVLLDDGSRQILRFLFPGDLIAISRLVYREVPETVTASTDAVVAPFECSALTDRLAALGRTSAKARVAAIPIEMRNRLRMIDKSIGDSFIWA